VEFYVHGKSIGKYTNKGAVEFSKKYIKQTDWVEIGKWGIRDSAYEVKKIRKERE
jgi:ribosomal protein S6